MKNKITLEQLKRDFFNEDDTVTVSARELQNFIIEKDNAIRELKSKIERLDIANYIYESKLKKLESNKDSNFVLDLKA